MAKFKRLVNDSDRARDEPPFSAEDQNAKTDFLEHLANQSGANAIVDSGGVHHRLPTPVGRICLVEVCGYVMEDQEAEDKAIGRYKGVALELDTAQWWTAKNLDLTFDMIGKVTPYKGPENEVELWYLPDIGAQENSLTVDDTMGEDNPRSRVIGIIVSRDYFNRLIVVSNISSIPRPTARYQVYSPLDDTLKPVWTALRAVASVEP